MDNEKLIQIKYRNWFHGMAPKRIKLAIDGWAGDNTWKVPQAWHCKPFADANTYGLELIYSWQTTCTVTCDDKGMCTFEGDFSQEKPDYLDKEWHPFASFAPFHFGYVAMVDIQTPKEHNLMVMPHPRFYSDRDGSIPCAVPGMLEMDWWPEIFFIVFKAPLPGHTLVFKHGDPIAQFLVQPRNIKYEIEPMNEEESLVRAQRQENLEKNWSRLCTRVFYCEDDKEFFDNKYKVLSGIARKEGNEAAQAIMDKPKTCPHWDKNPQVIDTRPEDKQSNVHHAPWGDEHLKKTAKNQELEKEFDPELMKEVDNLIEKNIKDEDISDEELQRLVTAYKMTKRQRRQDRSQKIRDKADQEVVLANQHKLHPKPPELIQKMNKEKQIQKEIKQQEQKERQGKMPAKKKEGEWVLGHKIEKLL